MTNRLILFLTLTACAYSQPTMPFAMWKSAAAAPTFAVAATDSTVLWLEADKITGKSNLDTMYAWLDTTASGLHVFQLTAAAKPLYIANAINGLPAVRFDGNDDRLFRNGVSGHQVTGPDAMTVYAVFSQNSAQANQVLWFANHDGSGATRIAGGSSFAGAIVWDHPNLATPRLTFSTPANFFNRFHLIEMYRSGDSLQVVIDDTVRATTTNETVRAPLALSSGLHIGNYFLDASIGFRGDIAAFVISKKGLPANRRAAYRAYLKSKYGTP